MNTISLLKVFIYFFSISSLQSTKGKVVDSHNKPIPYASIFIKGANIGTTSNETGEFTLKITNTSDSVTVSCLGYLTSVSYTHLDVYKRQALDRDGALDR